MNTFTLTIGKQSISFSVDELASMQAVLFDAARKPGQEAFRAIGAQRITATLSDETLPGNRQNHSGNHRYNEQADDGPILTQF